MMKIVIPNQVKCEQKFKNTTWKFKSNNITNKRMFESDEVLKHQKSLADATAFQGKQLESIAIAMEARIQIEQQRNSILLMRFRESIANKENIFVNKEDLE